MELEREDTSSYLHQLNGKGEPVTRTTDGRNRFGASPDQDKREGPKNKCVCQDIYVCQDILKGSLCSFSSCSSLCTDHFPSRLRKIEVYLDEAL